MTAARLLAACGKPVTATSANCSGQAAATTAAEVATIFADQIDLILDGGTTPGGLSSTLIGCAAQGRLRCLRKGALPWPTAADAVA
jgi:L-threonylcarbamoyladenylate synthase